MSNPNLGIEGIPYQIKKGQKLPGAGRPKNKFKALKEKCELSSEDVESIIKYLLTRKTKDLKEIMNNSDNELIVSAYASAIWDVIKKGKLAELETMLNRAVGKVSDNLHVETSLPVVINIIGKKADEY